MLKTLKLKKNTKCNFLNTTMVKEASKQVSIS